MFHTVYFVKEEEMFVKPKNIYYSSYHYVHFNNGFSVGGGNVYLHIGQIMQGSLSLTRGGLWEEKNCLCTSSSACGIQ